MIFRNICSTKLIFVFALPLLLVLSSFATKGERSYHFKFQSHRFLKHIPEPSDIVYDSATKHFFIVSDHGILFECELTGKIIRRAKVEGMDYEGVEIKDGFVYVSDESGRRVYKYRKDNLSLVTSYPITWGGAMNKAFESITYNYTKHCFVMVAEQPAIIVEFDDNFKELNRYPFRIAYNISGARWYKDELYLVSSRGACIYKCNPSTYSVKEKYLVKILNPEGIAFDSVGNVSITSDNEQRIYFFKNLPNNTVQ